MSVVLCHFLCASPPSSLCSRLFPPRVGSCHGDYRRLQMLPSSFLRYREWQHASGHQSDLLLVALFHRQERMSCVLLCTYWLGYQVLRPHEQQRAKKHTACFSSLDKKRTNQRTNRRFVRAFNNIVVLKPCIVLRVGSLVGSLNKQQTTSTMCMCRFLRVGSLVRSHVALRVCSFSSKISI